MIICKNFEKCQDPDLECPHQYPHESSNCCCGPMECDMVPGEMECLEIILKRKGEK